MVACCLVLGGCPPTQTEPPPSPAASDLQVEREAAVAEFVSLIALHNANAAALAEFESTGVVEIRRRDQSGAEKFDQCDIDVALATRGRGSVRLKKLSDTLAWIGSDGVRAWAFLPGEKPSRAVVFEGVRDAAFGRPEGASGYDPWALLTPESLRLLAGFAEVPPEYRLLRLPEADVLQPIASRYEVEWQATAALRASLRFGADRRAREVLLRGNDGALVARSELAEQVRVRAENLAQGAWPSAARKIRVRAPRLEGSAEIFLGDSTASIRRTKPHLFDFEEMLRRVRPDGVEYISRPSQPEPAKDSAP